MSRRPTADVLREIADALPYLALMRTSRPPQSGPRVRTSRDPAAPLRLETVDLLDHLHATLGSWVRLAHEDGLVEPDDWPNDSTLALCWWLAGIAELLESHDAGDDWREEVGDLWRRVRRALGEREPAPIRCTRVVDGAHCGTRLQGIDAEGAVTEVLEHWRWCRCPGCGMSYTFDAALKRLGALQMLTLRQCAAELGVDWDVLRKRLDTLGIAPDERDSQGRKLYHRDTVTRMREAMSGRVC